MADQRCPVCVSVLDGGPGSDGRRLVVFYPCPKCGNYGITIQAESALPHVLRPPGSAALVSHFIRRLPRIGKGESFDELPIVKSEWLDAVLKHEKLPDSSAQVVNLILWLGDNSSTGQYRRLSPETHQAVIGCLEGGGVFWVRDHLIDEGLVKSKNVTEQMPNGGTYNGDVYALSYKGWERYRELQQKSVSSKVAFMAMDFQHPAELDTVFWEHFKPAVAQTGFDLRRIDEGPAAGSIDNRLRLEVRRSRFAVVDLTYSNPGAYWEAGLAEGLGRNVFFTCREGEKPHFDTRQSYIVFWTPGNLNAATKRLKEAIRVTIPEAKQED